MTEGELPPDRLNRILVAVETIEESLGVLARKQRISREDYKNAAQLKSPTIDTNGMLTTERISRTPFI